MRYIMFVRAPASTPPGADPIATMTAFHDELARAGVLLDAAGLAPAALGWRVCHGATGAVPRVVEGPCADGGAPLAGYTLIEAPSREAALEWSRRCPPPWGEGVACEIEVRLLRDAGQAFHPDP